MKLETLKDLWIYAKNCRGNTKVIPLSLAKEKAIKWIKSEEKLKEKNLEKLKEGKMTKNAVKYINTQYDGSIRWVMKFFNITEEDLK